MHPSSGILCVYAPEEVISIYKIETSCIKNKPLKPLYLHFVGLIQKTQAPSGPRKRLSLPVSEDIPLNKSQHARKLN